MASEQGSTQAIFIPDLPNAELVYRALAPYDRPIGLRTLWEDVRTGVEHDLVRYPAGMRAKWHRHTAGHSILLLEGRMHINDRVIEPGTYVYLPPGIPMWHAPAGDEPCLFLIMFDGPFDVEVVDQPER